jgi:hypothetical protein
MIDEYNIAELIFMQVAKEKLSKKSPGNDGPSGNPESIN